MSRRKALARIADISFRLSYTSDDEHRRPLIAERNEIEAALDGYQEREDSYVHRVYESMKLDARTSA